MSTPSNSDPRIDQAAVTDASLVAAHEKLLGKQPDDNANYRLAPLMMLFGFSALIFFGGTYLGRFSGNFHPLVFNENAPPPSAKKVQAGPKTPEELYAIGKGVYAQVCVSCHQPNGMGLPPTFPPLVESEWVKSEERMVRIILHGLQGPIKVKGADFTGVMPAAGPGSGFNLNAEKVAAVATFVRKDWGKDLPPVTVEKVEQIRAASGGRGPWTSAELEKFP